MRDFTFTLSEDEVDSLIWLVEGNNAYEHIAHVLRIQIDQQRS